MPTSSPTPTRRKHRNRGNRYVGKMWLIMIFCLLSIMNYAASTITSCIGFFARPYLCALIIATFWSAILLTAIWLGQGWARIILSTFLIGFVLAQSTCIPDALVYYPALYGINMKILILFSCSNFFVAVFLLISKDIQSLTRHPSE